MAATISKEKTDLLHDNELRLHSQRVKHSTTIASLKERHRDSMLKKDIEVRMAREEAKEYIGLAHAMSDEVAESLSCAAKARKREMETSEISEARLAKLKKSNDDITQLRESIDTTREDMESKLNAALLEIECLRTQVTEQSDVIDGLEMKLIEAREEIDVSQCIYLNFLLSFARQTTKALLQIRN